MLVVVSVHFIIATHQDVATGRSEHLAKIRSDIPASSKWKKMQHEFQGSTAGSLIQYVGDPNPDRSRIIVVVHSILMGSFPNRQRGKQRRLFLVALTGMGPGQAAPAADITVDIWILDCITWNAVSPVSHEVSRRQHKRASQKQGHPPGDTLACLPGLRPTQHHQYEIKSASLAIPRPEGR